MEAVYYYDAILVAPAEFAPLGPQEPGKRVSRPGFPKLLCLLILVPTMCYGENCVASLSDKAREVISEFHDWRVVKLTDLPADDRKLWENSHNGQCPGVAAGNFSDDKLSYAVALLRNQPSGELEEQLIVLLPEGNSFRRTVVVKPTTVVGPFVIWKVPPGKYQGVDKAKAVQIAHDSFIYEKIEAYARQYYYDDGHLRSIVTAK